ncbi:MAG: hydantoinase B/oxoprolinase family protein [Lautropia sp.]
MARLGIDIGGTFTDFALEVEREGRLQQHFAKVLTTPQAPEQAVLEGTRRVLAQAGLRPADLQAVVHGTTLATNAVIERRGARIAFLTTEGFRDTLEMGTESRYDHYDLYVDKPEPVVPRHRRFAIPERIAADGSVLRALDEDAVRALLPQLDAAGVEAVAIGFLHSFVNPAHERQAAALLRSLRPNLLVSLSCEVAPEIREYERFATVCVNAYVQPVMAGYLARLETALVQMGVEAPLLLMLSNGGLCEVAIARRFPVRLLESGPAGGAILAAHVARALDIDRALLVDIGGTTAKLCFIDDGMPQTARTMEVARIARFQAGSGIPLRFPVVELAEIGAGGGSIAHRDSLGRLQVGPESAGSEPGPACYARGGTRPTVTDAHLLLGRLDAEAFGGGHMRLDAAACARAYAGLAGELGLSAEDAAWSVCEIVDENMANAVREHAVEVGKGVDGRTLIAIGGMAPLHAARLAAKLGLERVVVPVGAGVGSALGFLRAPIAFEATRSVMLNTTGFDAAVANAIVEPLIADLQAIVARAAPGREVVVQRTAWMRYRGQGHEIRVQLPARRFAQDDGVVLHAAFEQAYHALYGRSIAQAPVEILGWTVRVEAVPDLASQPAPAVAAGDITGRPARRRAYDQGRRAWQEARVLRIETLPATPATHGPALLVADETTIVVPDGFDTRTGPHGTIVLTRDAGEASTTPGAAQMPADIRGQVLWSRLIAVVEEQARTLMRTAFSPTVREAGDLAAGLFDIEGRLIAQAVTGTPGHVNSMAACAGHFLARYPAHTMREGDHFITNDPWLTSGHLHDITVLSPAFQQGRLVGFFACTCHQVDIGGLGMGPDARSIFEEGLYLPILPLARAGVLNEDVLEIVRANVRQPDAVRGDILSYVTANEVSARRLAATLDEFGAQGLERISDFVRSRSAAGMRAAIAKLPQGRFRHQLELDGYDAPVHIDCQLHLAGDHIRVDFDGTSAASPHGINLVLNYTRAYAAFGVRAAVAPEVPNNAGSLALVQVEAPRGSILNVQHPAPVCARHIIGQFLPEVVLGALAHALPGRMPAEGAACNWGLQLRGQRVGGGGGGTGTGTDGEDETREPFEILFFNAGGSGARPDSDGLSATCFPSGIRAIPVEICENFAPIVIWRKELLPASGGAGRLRGGLGQRVEVSTRDGAAFQFFGLFDRVRNPARGRDGGEDGAPGWVGLVSGRPLQSLGLQTVPAGEVLRIDVPGGGGYGAPEERDDQACRRDLEHGYVLSTTL